MNLANFPSPQYHHHNLTIHSFEVDFNHQLSITALFNLFQEIAWEHAKILHFGWEDLMQKEQFWVLSRVRVEVNRLPRWTENVTLVTYPRGVDGLFALRDYEMFESNGNRIIAASSSWLILNLQTRRPVRLTDFDHGMEYAQRAALRANPGKIASNGFAPVLTDNFNVKTGDIDVNGHVNNVRYIDWAYNAFDLDHYKKFSPAFIEVNFLAEGRMGDEIAIKLAEYNDNEHVIDITRGNDSKDLCRIHIKWQPIA